MADATLPTSTASVPQLVAARLRSLRTKIAMWFLVEGFAWLLLSLSGLVLLDLAIDYLFRMPWGQRCFGLAFFTGLIAGILIWRVIRPLCYTLSDDALCLQVERHHKQLGQKLISALQFSKIEQPPEGASATFFHATIAAGTEAAQQVDFAASLDKRRFHINLTFLTVGLVLIAMGAVAVATTAAGRTWYQRNVLLSNSVNWPQDTYLEVKGLKDGRFVMPRGESRLLEVEVAAHSKRIPNDLVVDFRGSRRRPSQKMQHLDQSNRHYKLELKSVYEEFQFRVRSASSIVPWISNARTPWMSVQLVAQPTVTDLRLEVTPPAYVGNTPQQLPPGKGPYNVLRGSRLNITGRSTKPLASAMLEINDLPQPFRVYDTFYFSTTLTAAQLVGGTYAIRLTDTESIQSRLPTSFAIRMRTDREPRVRATLHGISGMVVPRAVIPFTCNVSDDFSVTDLRLHYKWHDSEDATRQSENDVAFEQIKENTPAVELSLEDLFNLQPLNIPAGSTLEFKFQAIDNDNISGPNTGESTEYLVRVVTEEQLRMDLLRREKEQRQTLEHLLKTQEDLHTETAAMSAAVAGKEQLDAKQKQMLMKFQRQQKLVGTNLATISQRLKSFLLEVRNNRLEEEEGPLKRRLNSHVILPMDQLVNEGIPAAVQSLDKARRQTEDAKQRDATLGQAVDQQQAVTASIRNILLHLVKAEGYQEAVNMLYQIEKSQKGVFNLTEKELKERIRRLLEGDGSPENTRDDKRE